MDLIPDKWQAFADKQLMMQAAMRAKESTLAMQVGQTALPVGCCCHCCSRGSDP